MSINEILHKALMMGAGFPDKVTEVVDDLVKKGELSESQGARLVRECSEKMSEASNELGRTASELIKKTLEKMNIPTRDELDNLNKKVKSLSSKVKKLEESSVSRQ
jgi:polyhydroxyalkanoate synthesis regulator phasin